MVGISGHMFFSLKLKTLITFVFFNLTSCVFLLIPSYFLVDCSYSLQSNRAMRKEFAMVKLSSMEDSCYFLDATIACWFILFFCIFVGDIKCENVLVTSWNWLYLADFASFKPTYIPYDDPSDFSFFFDTGGRRLCYLAPEVWFFLDYIFFIFKFTFIT